MRRTLPRACRKFGYSKKEKWIWLAAHFIYSRRSSELLYNFSILVEPGAIPIFCYKFARVVTAPAAKPT
jgi:hypothetical protein